MKIIGHRGARGLAPENTLAGFKAALAANVDGIEFDVRVTRDEVPILNHDEFIPGPRRGKHIIAKCTYKELKALRPDLLTLDQALGFLQGKTFLYIEIKPGVNTEPVTDCLRPYLRRKLSTGSFVITSFDFKVLREVKAALPTAALGVNEKWSGMRAGRRARALGTKRIIMNQRWLWPGFIKLMSKSYELSGYTINNPRQAERFKAAGLHAAITDYPGKL